MGTGMAMGGEWRGWKRVWMVVYANKPRQSLDIPLYGYESAEGEDEGETHTGNWERTRLDGGGGGGKVAEIHCI